MAKITKLTRVRLSRNGKTTIGSDVKQFLNVYVDDHPHLKVGVQITLKDSEDKDELWTVDEIHETVEKVSIKQGWNNNI